MNEIEWGNLLSDGKNEALSAKDAEIGSLRCMVTEVRNERDKLAAALNRQIAKNDKWQSTFEDIDEDDMTPHAHAELSNVYRLDNDAVADDMADSIVKQIAAKAKREVLHEAAEYWHNAGEWVVSAHLKSMANSQEPK